MLLIERKNLMAHPIEGMMNVSMEKIRQMVDTNTIIGQPIHPDEHTTIIPVSKVSFGFASGGSDLPTKFQKETFGGAGGAGISMEPLAFLVIHDGDVRVIQLTNADASLNNLLGMVPSAIDHLGALFKKKDAKEEEEPKPEADATPADSKE